jgi:hypothetical protein
MRWYGAADVAKGPLMITCPSCGRQSAKWARFCSKCGRRMPKPGEMAILPAVHRDAAPTTPMEPVDPPATESMEPLEAPVTAPTEAVDPPVHPTVARRRVRSSPPAPPASRSGSSRTLAFAAGGAAVLLIVVAGYLIGKAANSGSNSSSHSPSVSRSVGATSASSAAKAGGTTSASGSTTSASGSATAAPASAHTATFTGRTFSIKYPAGWIIQTNEKRYPWGTDTTVVSPTSAHTLLRVDVSPNLTTSDPLTASRSEINQVSQQPGYQQLALNSNTVNGNPGERWEFLVNENGVVEHSVDQFIITPSGDGLAILTQAPASEYASLAKEFTALRQTIAVP